MKKIFKTMKNIKIVENFTKIVSVVVKTIEIVLQ